MTWMRASHLCCIAMAASLSLPHPGYGQDGAAVEFARTGYRLTAIGARVSVSARVVDARRRAVPNAPIAYRTSDPDIATVTNLGVVQSRRVGRTRVWAVSGTDSASALIVVDQWATTFSFSPAALTFDAIGRQVPLLVELRDAVGNPIADQGRSTAQCRARDERIALVSATRQVTSRANGTTWVRCTDKGISDSVRVDVRQRPARVAIAGKLAIGTRQVNDTFRLRAVALGPANDTIRDARTTWASLVPGIVSIHPLTGASRAIGPGTTRIVTQVGDVTDTVAITVDGTPVQTDVADADSASATRQASITLNLIFPVIPETTTVTFAARDGAGQAIANAERDVRLTSSNERVVKVLPNTRRIVPLDTGVAWVVARLPLGDGTEVVDSMQITPRTRAAVTAAATTTASATPFERPTFNVDSQRVFNQGQLERQLKAIVDSGIGRVTSGRSVSFEAIGGHVEHEARVAGLPETRSGITYGVTAQGTPFRWLVLGGTFRMGDLNPKSDNVGEPMHLTEVEGELAWWPVSWLGFAGTYMVRGQSTELSSQVWNLVGGTLRLRGAFVGDAVRLNVGGTLFPSATFSGRTDKPEIVSFAGEAGLEGQLGPFTAAFIYYVERFTFAEVAPLPERRDLFSSVRFRLGGRFSFR